MKQEIEQKELGMGNFQGYPSLLRQIKHRVSFAQQKAMYAANEELLRMNWDIGEMLTKSQEADGWGKKTLQRLAVDLKNEYPERKGFSVRNMQCMMQFYNEYNKELTMAKVRNIPITQSMIAQLKNNVITFNGRLSIPGAAYFLFLLPLFKYFSPKTLEVTRKSRIFAPNKYNIYIFMIMRTGDKVLISPDLTHAKDWTQGEVIEVENNPFVGIVISAKTADGNIFFGYKDLFEPAKEAVCTH